MKSNNIIMGVLVAVIAVMGVAFAAFSTTLTINGSATIDSNWNITFTAGTCTAVSKDANAESNGTVSVSGTTATVTANMMSPGDTLACTVIVNNEGSLAAVRDSWAITKAVTNSDAYEVTATAPTVATLAAGTGTETLTINVTYKDVTAKPTGSATFTGTATYKQAGV